MFVLDGSGVVVEEQAVNASNKSRPDQRPLDKISMLSDWTAVDKTDHMSDQSSDHEDTDVSTAQVNAFDLTHNAGIQEEPAVEPVAEDAIVAGAKVTPRTNLLGEEPFGKLTATGQPANEDVITVSETSVAMRSAPRTTLSDDPNEADRVKVAPTRKTLKEGWAGQAASSDEFAWLAAEPVGERRVSVDSVDLTDELITAETTTQVESAAPLPAVSEDVVRADVKATAKFDVDFSGLVAGRKPERVASKPPAQSQPAIDVTEDQIQTTKVPARKLDDFLSQTKIEFSDRTLPDSDDTVSLDDVETVPESEVIHAAPVQAQFAGPHVEEEAVIRQSKRSDIVIPEFPAELSVSAKVDESPKKKSSGGGIFGFFGRKSKNEDQKSPTVEHPKIKSNSLDKKTVGKQPEVDRKAGATLPADAKTEKNGRGGRFRIGLNFGFGKDTRSSPTTEDQAVKSPKGQQSPRTNSSGESAKSPSKTNIRVFEIMAGQQNSAADVGVDVGLKEQPDATSPPSGPALSTGVQPSIELTKPSTPTTSVTLVSPAQPDQPPRPIIDVHVSAPLPPTVPAFSSQYMVAVAIDFGSFQCLIFILSGFFFFLSSFFFRQLPSKVAKRNSTKIGHMVGSKCNLKMHVQNLGYPFPHKSGVQKPPFFDDCAT